jgi:hypothetical protein
MSMLLLTCREDCTHGCVQCALGVHYKSFLVLKTKTGICGTRGRRMRLRHSLVGLPSCEGPMKANDSCGVDLG